MQFIIKTYSKNDYVDFIKLLFYQTILVEVFIILLCFSLNINKNIYLSRYLSFYPPLFQKALKILQISSTYEKIK